MNVVPVSRSVGSLEESGAGPTGTSSQGIFLAGSGLGALLRSPLLLTALPSASFFQVGPAKCLMICLLSVTSSAVGTDPVVANCSLVHLQVCTPLAWPTRN